MLATYGSFLVVFAVASVIGQAILALAGERRASPLAPAVGLGVVIALAWAAVRLPGEATAVAIGLGLVVVVCALALPRQVEAPPGRDLALLAAVAFAAALAASLPFLVEGRFGILGTGLNPDMSQHLFAADRLASGGEERLIAEGYPLGPHALAVGLTALGPGLVQAFGGLMIATAVAASLVPLALLGGLGRGWRAGAALVVGFAYLVAAYLVQGAFKETLQALFLLAFAVGLHELGRGWRARQAPPQLLSALPLTALAVGSVYAYSFPGLAWLAGAAGVWAALELAVALRAGGLARARRIIRRAAPAVAVALAFLVAAIAPEASRLVEFARFETFDPDGPGLGNLFGRLSPLVALGIWPSGDFRVTPGDGAAPAIAFWVGGALALAALGFGLRGWLARGERAVPAALGAAAVLWLYSLTAGTPYQEAKALALIAPLVALIAIRGLWLAGPRPLALAYAVLAAASSALVLANGPVGPPSYSPALAELRERLGSESVLVLAESELINEQHGRDYLVWELRGNRICVAERPPAPGLRIERHSPSRATLHYSDFGLDLDEIAQVLVVDEVGAQEGDPAGATPLGIEPIAEIEAGPGYRLFETPAAGAGPGPCPFIPDGARADPAAAGGAPAPE